MLTENEKTYFNATRPLVKMELALVRELVFSPTFITKPEEAAVRYAINFARLGPFRTPNGHDVDLFDELASFRNKAIDLLSRSINVEKNTIDRIELVRTLPALQDEVLLARHLLVDKHADEFGEDHIDREVCRKVYVSVAGGGGGSGLVYVGAYKLLEDHGIRPRYIVGTSIGSMIGAFRALSVEFDVAKLILQSRQIQLGISSIFLIKPTSGKFTFGLPAAIKLDLYPSAEKYFRSLGREVPTFENLKVPFEAVVCGIKSGGLKHSPNYYAGEAPSLNEKGMLQWRPSTLKWLVRAFNTVAREFTNPELLTEVVFGRDKYTKRVKVVDGVGFSCAIPGMLHYDVFRRDDATTESLRDLMHDEGLAFLVDGGLVNNVPSRIAWEGVYRGVIGTRNAFILAFDSFSPQINRNVFFLPAQGLLSMNAKKNLKYSHYTKAFPSAPNPFHLIGLPKGMIRMFKRGISDLTPDLPFIHRMLAYVPGPKENYGARSA